MNEEPEDVGSSPEPKRKPIRIKPVLQDHDRITIVLNVRYEHVGENPYGVDITTSQLTDTQEQPYNRRFKTNEKWRPLDTGWVEQPGLILIENIEGRGLQTNPTEEERQAIAKRVVELSYGGDSAHELILPGGFFLGFPVDAKAISIRCQSETAMCRITVLPK